MTGHAQRVRGAIYTRKSSEEGLEQAFNSLDAQREACAAYILSQASEGWTALPDVYDDGGLSGGSLDRPALQRLLGEVAAGRVDTVVVYKVDRLTRSLLDFSKLVEAFDKAGTSFVSVTQSFNTTTSMGRLTLNMLLSFAQFEREVTAERIRDKIAASKARGMWMGGTPPLGYEPNGRSLKIVETHASLVRAIFDLYLKLGKVRLVAEHLGKGDVRSPTRTSLGGKTFGNAVFSRGQIYSILKCPTYIGEIHHQGKVHKALHDAIIDRDIWDRAHALLANNFQGKRGPTHPNHSLLAGKLADADNEPLLPVHATSKDKVRYRYYVSSRLQHEAGADGLRIPATEIEAAVCTRIAQMLSDGLALAGTAQLQVVPTTMAVFIERCAAMSLAAAKRDPATIRALVQQIRMHDSRIEIVCDTSAIAAALGVAADPNAPDTITVRSDVRLTRSGRAMRLIQNSGQAVTAHPDRSLVALILKARGWWAMLRQGEMDITMLAQREGVSPAYITRVVRLAFLSPKVVEAVLAGTLRAAIVAAALTATAAVEPGWQQQETAMLPIPG